MGELEARIATVELAVLKLAAAGFVSDPTARQDAIASIKAGLEADVDDDERMVRAGALQLMRDARDRFREPAVGIGWVLKALA